MNRRAIALVVAATAAITLHNAPGSGAAPSWAPEASATIHPGVNVGDGNCTANFVFYDSANVYIGQAAHCVGLGAINDLNGCEVESLALGTPVQVDGASQPGTLAYSSWLTMQAAGETDPDICYGNDFSLIRIHPADAGKVNPTVPVWGGPTGVDGDGLGAGEQVHAYGHSLYKLGLDPLSPMLGTSIGSNGWTHQVYTLLPGIPGDSGSAYMNSAGQAVGVLSSISGVPPAANNIGDVGRELAYLNAHGAIGGGTVQLATGTRAFTGGASGLVSGLL